MAKNIIKFETRQKIKRLSQTPGMQSSLQQYYRYEKKYQHHIVLVKIVIAFLAVMLILKVFGVVLAFGAFSKLLVGITALISVMIPVYLIPIWLLLHHSRAKYLHKVQSIANQHHLNKYTDVIIKQNQKGM